MLKVQKKYNSTSVLREKSSMLKKGLKDAIKQFNSFINSKSTLLLLLNSAESILFLLAFHAHGEFKEAALDQVRLHVLRVPASHVYAYLSATGQFSIPYYFTTLLLTILAFWSIFMAIRIGFICIYHTKLFSRKPINPNTIQIKWWNLI